MEYCGARTLVAKSYGWVPRFRYALAAMAVSLLLASGQAWAQEAVSATPAAKIDTGDTAWMLASSALVLLMTPGLAFFYGGLVRSKNVLNALLMSMGAMAVLGVLWAVVGYSLAFGGTGNPFVGSLEYLGLNGVGVTENYPHAAAPQTIPHQAFMVFQMMFFIITPALISGALVERMKFSTYLLFIALWGLLVYCPVAHWVWHKDGWLFAKGVMDFAGGAVVHVNAGFAALAVCLALGPRKDYRKEPLRPHSLPLCLLGVGLLWFGWFGFNAGSAIASGSLATAAFVNTQLGAAAAMFTWMMIDQITRKEMTALGAGTGAVAGLVGITPACGFVSPMGALAVGAITSAVCYLSATLRAKSALDDSLDAFAVHGVGGFTGALLTGVFSTKLLADTKVNTAALPGLLEGNFSAFLNQFIGVAAVALYTFTISFVLCKVLQAVTNLRVSEEQEDRGLDISLHGEEAYAEMALV
jgi:Amt family ammonium transporter